MKDNVGIAICVAVFLLTEFTSLSPVFFIIGAGLLGVILKNFVMKEVVK